VSRTDFDEIDFFRATDLYQDPYPYYEYVRSHGPVWREPHRNVVIVTGFEEVMSVYNNAEVFSSCNTVAGPWTKFPVPLEGDDISAIELVLESMQRGDRQIRTPGESVAALIAQLR
jgi:cytochrome P450